MHGGRQLALSEAFITDSAGRLMLLDDFGSPVGWKADLETKSHVLSQYAALQVESAPMLDELLALGAFDRSPEWLAGAIAGLLADRNDLLGLEPDERGRPTGNSE